MSASRPRPRPPRRDGSEAARPEPALVLDVDVDVEEEPLGLSLGILSLSGAARRGLKGKRTVWHGSLHWTARRQDGKTVSREVRSLTRHPSPMPRSANSR